MSMLTFQKSFLAITGLALSTMIVMGQNSITTTSPPMCQSVSQVLQLAQTKIGDDTIIAYIRNTGNCYRLNAKQIIYLRQQEISEKVINFMLSQSKAASAPVQPAAQPDNSYYSDAYYASPYYYPYYAGPYPGVLSFGFGGRFRGGFRGGDFHGGGFHSGGGFHGGGGFRGGSGHR